MTPVRYPQLRYLFSCLAAALLGAALAGEPATWQGAINGVPTWVTVVPRAHDIDEATRLNEPWWRWGNTSTDSYVFSFRQPDQPRLILSFRSEVEAPDRTTRSALIYAAEPGATLEYRQLDTGGIRVQKVQPYIEVRPLGGAWLVEDGKTNYNLDIVVKAPRDIKPGHSPASRPIEKRMRVRSSTPGVPDYHLIEVVGLQPRERSIRKFSIASRAPEAPPFKVADPVMPTFPLLGFGPPILRSSWWRENPPPLYFDTTENTMETYNVVGFQEGGIYRVSSTSLAPLVDFESPFITYSFDDRTRYAHLVIRADSFPQKEDSYARYADEMPRTSFRYSWKLEEEKEWRYSLQLAGPIPYEHTHTYGDVTVVSPDYHETPSWIMEQEWPILTFVESIDGTLGSEGIYFYTVQGNAPWAWLAGDALEPPRYDAPYLPEAAVITDESLLGLPDGFRGEYHSAYMRTPELYLSPVDNRLHLSHALGGVWNLGQGSILRTFDHDEDGFVDTWQREEIVSRNDEGVLIADPGVVRETLYLVDGYLVHVNDERVVIRQASAVPASLTLSPPQDKESWLAFRETMRAVEGTEPSPWDLEAWLAAFPGEQLTVPGAVTDVLLDDMSFAMNLASAGPAVGSADIPFTARPTPQLLSYERATATWEQQPLDRLALTAELHTAGLALEDGRVRRWTPTRLVVTVRNTGPTDWFGDLALRAEDQTLASWGNISIPSGVSITQEANWTPSEQGVQELVLDAGERVLALAGFEVEPAPRTGDDTPFTLRNSRTPLYLSALIGLIALTAVVCVRQIGRVA